jgi:hypothetical protein
LIRDRTIISAAVEHFNGLLLAINQAMTADHFRDTKACTILSAEYSEREVGVPCKRSENQVIG